jgi:hypothetical protein
MGGEVALADALAKRATPEIAKLLKFPDPAVSPGELGFGRHRLVNKRTAEG